MLKISKFYEEKLQEKQKRIEILQQRLEEMESASASPESQVESAPVYTVPCIEVGDTIYETDWMLNLFEEHDFIAFKDMSKANGVNHQVFWENLDGVPGKYLTLWFFD